MIGKGFQVEAAGTRDGGHWMALVCTRTPCDWSVDLADSESTVLIDLEEINKKADVHEHECLWVC